MLASVGCWNGPGFFSTSPSMVMSMRGSACGHLRHDQRAANDNSHCDMMERSPRRVAVLATGLSLMAIAM